MGTTWTANYKWFGQRVPEWLQSEVGPKKSGILFYFIYNSLWDYLKLPRAITRVPFVRINWNFNRQWSIVGTTCTVNFKWFGQRVPKWLQSEVGPKKAAILLTHPGHLSVGCQNLPIGNVPVITSHAAPVITSHAAPVITGTLPWSRERNVSKLYKVNFFCIIRKIFQQINEVIWNYIGCYMKRCFIMNFVKLLA